jgi:hypothetical protein
MGQPEDYIIEDEKTQTINKPIITVQLEEDQLYRDKDKKMIGGVAAGLGYYFGSILYG